MMKIVADENIPHIKHYFLGGGDLVLKPGRAIQRQDLLDADMLLVRSITQVNEELLKDTSVKFVGSATTGVDHLDTHYLEEAGIQWAAAEGCNAMAVAEYVVCAIAALENKGLLLEKNKRAGVIGVGRIGQLVVDKLKILGFDVVQCDPLRAVQTGFVSTTLDEFHDLDFISLHTPLTYEGSYPTYHLIEKMFLQRQKSGCVLLNAGRGAAIKFSDVKQYGKHLQWCLDVWEQEPNVDHDILALTQIATPHIAGYSVQSKYRGVEMIYQAALQKKMIVDNSVAAVPLPVKKISLENSFVNWRDVVLKIYNPLDTSVQMKEVLLKGTDTFDNLRKNFIERYEFGYVEVLDVRLSEEDSVKLKKLGFL